MEGHNVFFFFSSYRWHRMDGSKVFPIVFTMANTHQIFPSGRSFNDVRIRWNTNFTIEKKLLKKLFLSNSFLKLLCVFNSKKKERKYWPPGHFLDDIIKNITKNLKKTGIKLELSSRKIAKIEAENFGKTYETRHDKKIHFCCLKSFFWKKNVVQSVS